MRSARDRIQFSRQHRDIRVIFHPAAYFSPFPPAPALPPSRVTSRIHNLQVHELSANLSQRDAPGTRLVNREFKLACVQHLNGTLYIEKEDNRWSNWICLDKQTFCRLDKSTEFLRCVGIKVYSVNQKVCLLFVCCMWLTSRKLYDKCGIWTDVTFVTFVKWLLSRGASLITGFYSNSYCKILSDGEISLHYNTRFTSLYIFQQYNFSSAFIQVLLYAFIWVNTRVGSAALASSFRADFFVSPLI